MPRDRRACADIRCPRPAVPGHAWCEEHLARHSREEDAEYRRRHPRAGDPRGTQRWRRIAAAYLAMHPLCQRCGKALARQVHHRVAIAAGGDPWDTANLLAVCLRCHADLEREERPKRKGGSNCG